MNVGSLFSGIGGIELGFEREGFHTEWFIENNPYCQAVLHKHWPKTKIYGDITKVDFTKLRKVEIITGGFPCQDISVAGKKAGLSSGKRSSLWRYYAKAISTLRPQVALIENVPNLLNLGLDQVLADLAEIGYNAEWLCLSAREFGALHKRERIFIIAYSDDFRQSWERNRTFNSSEGIQDKYGNLENGIGRGRLSKSRPDKNIAHDIIASNSISKRFRRGTKKGYEEAQDGREIQGRNNTENSNGIRRQDDGWDSSPIFITDDCIQRIQRFRDETLQGKQGLAWCKDVRSVEELFQRSDIPQPLLRRNRNGVSRKLDTYLQKERIKAIGNAVVPQVAQFLARQIKEVTT